MTACPRHGGELLPFVAPTVMGECQTTQVLLDVLGRREKQNRRWGRRDPGAENGTGLGVQWVPPSGLTAAMLEKEFRAEYEATERAGRRVSWMQLVREEVAEAFMESDEVRLRDELLDVAALCVQWVEELDRKAAGLQ